MYEIKRRDLILSSAAAAAIFGIGRQVVVVDGAMAQKAPDAAKAAAPAPAMAAAPKPFAKFKVGSFEVTNIYDGVWEKPHDPAFIKNASVDETKAALKAGGQTDAHVPIHFTVTVVKTPKNLIMFDSGTGGQLQPTSGKMAENMKAAGIDPAKIDTIIVTHFHPDHIFGLMAKDTNARQFGQANLLLPETEYKWWTDAGVFTKLPEARHGLAKRIQATFPSWKDKVTQIQAGKEVVPGVRAVDSAGHTPGHTSYIVSSGKSQLLVLGDVAGNPALFVKNPGWHAVFDADAALAEKNRRALFDRAIADKMTVAGYHFGMPGAGTFKKDGKGYALVPVKA
jgi:glyoxylase-like metal-dependent hydrolase (beta-lactamase superfamily II)